MTNPYPGPRPFSRDEFGIFAGRDHEISELTSLIVSHQVVLLYAQSGAGKTSIVNAGLSNSLSERGIRLLPVARVGIPVPTEIPLDEVANVYSFSMACDILPEIAVSDPWRRQATLVDVFNRLPEALDDFGERILSVCAIDQFEELFSVYPERWPDREKFFVEVSALLAARPDVRILFALREDSLAAFNHLASLLPEGGRTRYRIERLREDEARAAILKPLEGTRLSFAPDVAETVVSDLMNITVASATGGVVGVRGEFVEPVQLQVVCYTLLEKLPETTTSITLETYRKFGDPDEALEGFYSQALQAAKASTGIDESELREWFDRTLITSAGTRGLVFQDVDATGGMSNHVVQVLEERHVIRPEIRSGSKWYELTHDRFIRPIQRSNLTWKAHRRSSSFDVRYAEEVQTAARRGGISEEELRKFLESLSSATASSRRHLEQAMPEDALAELVDAGLIRRESVEGVVKYSRAPLIAPGWRVRATARRSGGADDLPAGLPPEFLAADSHVAQDVVLDPTPATRNQLPAAGGGVLDLRADIAPGHSAILVIRHPSNALTFHLPVQSTRHNARSALELRFQVAISPSTTRAPVVRAIVVAVIQSSAESVESPNLPKVVEVFEKHSWKKRGLKEGWFRVNKDALAAGSLLAGTPVSPARSLLFIHGPFANAASTFSSLTSSDFFERVKDAYDDRIFAFDHFTLSRTPQENARMLLEQLPEQTTTFDVIAHSRGGLVLRALVERSTHFGPFARRFKLGRAVLVASPNEGTPVAKPERFDGTVVWIANLLELFPDNSLTTAAEFVANSLMWLAKNVTADLPGLSSMDGDPEMIAAVQSRPTPPFDAYSALVANYHPIGETFQRLLDAGLNQFFGTANDLFVPTESGWHIDRSNNSFIPGSRIGCFGPGGNLPGDLVTHFSLFSPKETSNFLVNALLGRPQNLNQVDPQKSLPDRLLLRGDMPDASVSRLPGETPAAADTTTPPSGEALRITVINGDLTYEPGALLLGHYRALQLTGTEKVMDRLLGGTMTKSLEMGVYPESIGSHQIFINSRPNLERWFMPGPKAVIIVGLGQEGKLRATDLVQSVRQAVIAWAQRQAENRKQSPAVLELAATLLGSGGTGVSAGDAARLVAQGVYEANQLLQNDTGDYRRWPTVSHLHFVELYLDRATDAWRGLQMQARATPGRYVVEDVVKPGIGRLDRPADSGYRGAEFDFISVETRSDNYGTPTIAFTLDTRRAGSEVRGQRAQNRLLTELVATASNELNRDQQLGRTLFNLLMPVELEPYLAGSSEMQIELDPQTARIPWELLDTKSESDSELPWAIRVKLLRKLRIAEFRQSVTDVTADVSALVIGEPECPPEYPRLFGARSEALAVRSCLTAAGALDTTDLISDDPSHTGASARTVVNALFEKPWRIVHIVGHGAPGKSGAAGGVVLSNGTFLGPDEFRNMRTVPELVFINCCHLASPEAGLLHITYDRAEFAAGIAGALIAIGVRCVVAAGWAVDGDAARVFAKTFYSSLLRGNRFVVAVGEARAAAYERSPNVNTWGAYQCYGDPDWFFRGKASDAVQFDARDVEDFSGIGSATALKLELKRIVVRTRYQGADVAEQLRNLAQLQKLFAPKWGSSGDVAELFGEAFVEAGDAEAGMEWYERAVEAPDARASIRAAEQLANVRARVAWEIVDNAARHLEDRKKGEKAGVEDAKARAAARRARADAERSMRKAITRADRLLAQSLALLKQLAAVKQTMVRASLIGAAYRRWALVDSASGRYGRLRRDLLQMRAAYQDAQTLGEKSGDFDAHYPAANRLMADVALYAGTPRWPGVDRGTAKFLQQSLSAHSATDPDFWSAVGETELDMYQALAARKLAQKRKQIGRAYDDLHKRVTASRMWRSVWDNAYLVLSNYASRTTGKERAAAHDLLAQLRQFAHPEY